MKGYDKVIYNYDDLDEFGTNFVDKQQVDEQAHNMDVNMVNTHHDDADTQGWKHVADEHEDPQGWGQWQRNSWTQHAITYSHCFGVGLTGKE